MGIRSVVRDRPANPATRLVRTIRSNSLTRNSICIVATSAVNAGLGYLYWTAAARLMPASAVGLGSAVVSAMVILSLATHLGAGAGLIARLPTRRTRADWLLTMFVTQSACGLLTLVTAVAALLPLAAIVPPLRVLTEDPVLAGWFVVGAVSWTGADLLDSTFVAQRRAGMMLVRNGISSAGKLLGLVLIGWLGHTAGADLIVATWALSGLVGVLVGLWLCHSRIHPFGRVPLRAAGAELRQIVRSCLGQHAISVCGMVPAYLLPVVVTARLGAQDNAYFYITWMVGSAIFMISPAVAAAVFAEGSHDPSRLRALSLGSARTVAALVLPAIVVLALIGNWVLHVFGAGYAAHGYVLLLVLLASAVPDGVTNIAVSTLRVRNRLGWAGTLNGAMALIAVVGGWLVTPWLGITGVGACWLAAQLAGTIAVLVAARRIWPAERNPVVSCG